MGGGLKSRRGPKRGGGGGVQSSADMEEEAKPPSPKKAIIPSQDLLPNLTTTICILEAWITIPRRLVAHWEHWWSLQDPRGNRKSPQKTLARVEAPPPLPPGPRSLTLAPSHPRPGDYCDVDSGGRVPALVVADSVWC